MKANYKQVESMEDFQNSIQLVKMIILIFSLLKTEEFMNKVLKAIHQESINRQTKVMNK